MKIKNQDMHRPFFLSINYDVHWTRNWAELAAVTHFFETRPAVMSFGVTDDHVLGQTTGHVLILLSYNDVLVMHLKFHVDAVFQVSDAENVLVNYETLPQTYPFHVCKHSSFVELH